MFYILGLLAVLCIVIVYFSAPGSRLWRAYRDEVVLSREATQLYSQDEEPEPLTEDQIRHLPQLLQTYLIRCGYLGKPIASGMRVDFGHVDFRMSPKSRRPMVVFFQQHNFAKRPDRIGFLGTRVFGVPVQAKDSSVDGAGSMTIVLGKQLPLAQETGEEMDRAQLVTCLGDGILLPAFFLQDYLTFEQLAEDRLGVTLRYKEMEVGGEYLFGVDGEILRFTTQDRLMDKKQGHTPWSVEYLHYRAVGELRQPGVMRAIWHLEQGDDVYFEGKEPQITYID